MRSIVVLALSLCASVGTQEWRSGYWRGHDGYYFRQWTGYGLFNTHGLSPNPLRIVLNDGLECTGNFTRTPPTTITSEPPGLKLVVDGETSLLPEAMPGRPVYRTLLM